MFELAKRVFDELSRKPALAQVAIQEKEKTATETQAIQQQDATQGAYKVDKFKDFLTGFFYDWAKLTQKNMRGMRNISVENRNTGEKESRQVLMGREQNDLMGGFNSDINIETFVMPNKELKRRQFHETIAGLQLMEPFLREVKKKLNPQRIVSEELQNVNARDPEGFLMDIPVRTIDQ